MRNYLLLLFAAVLLCNPAVMAQDLQESTSEEVIIELDKPYRVSIGAKAAWTFASISSDIMLHDKKYYLSGNGGYSFGAAVNWHIGRWNSAQKGGTGRFAVQLEALYNKTSINHMTDFDINMDLLQIPLMLQFYVIKNGFIELGGTYSRALSISPENVSHQVGAGRDAIMYYYNIGASDYSDVKLSAGLGYKWKFVTAGVRYNHGFSKLAENFPLKNHNIQFSLTFMFDVVK